MAAQRFLKSVFHIGFFCLALSACQTVYETPAVEISRASVLSPQGQILGRARIYSHGGDVTLNLALQGLPTGSHRVLIYRDDSCEDDNGLAAQPAFTALPDLPISERGIGTMSAVLQPRSQTSSSVNYSGHFAIIILGGKMAENGPATHETDQIGCGTFAPIVPPPA